MAFTKVSVDAAAKTYFELLWDEYGEDLVRNIPRRIKAALLEGKKVASADDSALILPVAHATGEDGGLILEGLYKDQNSRLMFHASFDIGGNLVDIKSFGLR